MILSNFFIDFAGAPTSTSQRQIATLTVLSLFALLIDEYLNEDLGKSGRSIVKRKWRETSRKLLSVLPPDDRRTIKSGAKKLEYDFRSSLQSNSGAQAISKELGALCLAACVQYQSRHQRSADFARTKNAVLGMIKAFERR